MLINFVQAYPVGSSIHVQATGPAFPTGYASGDVNVTKAAVDAIRAQRDRDQLGSLRPGSRHTYGRLTVADGDVACGGEFVFTVAELVELLNAPSPAYGSNDAAAVTENVKRRLEEAAAKKTSFTKNESEELAALREENQRLREENETLRDKLDSLRSVLNADFANEDE